MQMIKSLIVSAGIWRAVLSLPAGELPFNFEVKNDNHQTTLYVINGDERIEVKEVRINDDSIFIKLPVFDSEIKAKWSENSMTGEWVNYSRKTNQSIPFSAEHGITYRFSKDCSSSVKLAEKWEVHFSPATKDSSFAIGLFRKSESHVAGTFLTATGDYRFLDGCMQQDSLFLSCFDGAHAYLFKAKVSGNKISGKYYSGNHWEEHWDAVVNETAELPDPFSITSLKNIASPFAFSGLTTDSILHSFPDDQYLGKVMVIQIMGSWCPNCMDETAFLAEYYLNNAIRGCEIIGLSFEKTSDFKKAAANVLRVKKRFNTKYEILVAGNREAAGEKMNMLSKINGYPTTIFIDRRGKVRKIHTGFNGPATGNYYEKEKDDFTRLMETLLSEK